MEEILDARDQLLNEKADLLAERELLMYEEIRQLKAQLAEEREKAMAANLIAEQALQAGMKSTRNWKKEKKRRKIAEEILRGLQGILHDSVTAGLLPTYESHAKEIKNTTKIPNDIVQEPESETPSARYVLTVYENFLVDVELPHFWNMKLLREHANQYGIEDTGQAKDTLRDSVRQAIHEFLPLAEPLVLLGYIEERLKQKTCGDLSKPVLEIHCKYYSIDTSNKSKADLKQLLLHRLN